MAERRLIEERRKEVEQKIILVGNPNVGKSVIFNLLTGSYATISNYPGTTVEISQGKSKIHGKIFTVIDTPGINDFSGRTDDQRVTRDILLGNPDATAILVVDAKNLKRGLGLGLFLCEIGIRFIIVLNMIDEANDRGIFIDHKKLSEICGVPVVPMIAVEHVGFQNLKKAIFEARSGKCSVSYPEDAEKVIDEIEKLLPETGFKKRGLAIFLASANDMLGEICEKIGVIDVSGIEGCWRKFQEAVSQPIYYMINTAKVRYVEKIIESVVEKRNIHSFSSQKLLDRLIMHPFSGILIAVFILILMYLIVGKIGAGFLVDLIEKNFFGRFVNPFFEKVFSDFPSGIRDFFVGNYGIISMALTYGLGIVLPITTMFFLFFGFLEDCGYLPRLAFLTDRIFKSIGLTGKAIFPLVLGLGCGTMATLTTRILDTKKEKIIATALLALAIPCSAQLGVIFGILGNISVMTLLLWLLVILIVMVIIGSSLNLLISGDSLFSMEIPPLRLPFMKNIAVKTSRRIVWYLKEALPLFVLGTFILFMLDKAGFLDHLISGLSPVVSAMGLPDDMGRVFVMGFLRRDYGAAGLFDLFNSGMINQSQAVVSCVVLTLFVPCIAQFFVMIKERGAITAFLIFILSILVAFFVGILLNAFISFTGLFNFGE